MQTPESLAADASAKQSGKPKFMATAVPEKDAAGMATGNYTMQLSGDPDAVQDWISNQKSKVASAAGGAASAVYKTAADVKAAVTSGALSRDAAKGILQKQFGMQ